MFRSTLPVARGAGDFLMTSQFEIEALPSLDWFNQLVVNLRVTSEIFETLFRRYEDTAAAPNFKVLEIKRAPIRLEAGQPIEGLFLVLERRP